MDLSPKIEEEEVEKFGSKVPVLSEYVSHEQPCKAAIPKENFDSGYRPFHHPL